MTFSGVYQYGDDIRAIDWNLHVTSARKGFEEERS
jgi:uncharacterized protein (DUF58 family)